MLNTKQLSSAIRFALFAGATSMFAAPAFAQAEQQEGEATQTLERVNVVGSRIKRTEFETSQPVFTLSREDIQAQGLTSIGDVLQNLTSNGSALNSTFNNGGNGETRVSLRNLGSGRTLVLVNGRRWVGGTGLGGAVDLNTIPTAAVERIEVLKDGASTIYGSDAIAGVVNLVLRSNFDGAEANAYFGQYAQGDGNRQSSDFTIGASGERSSVLLGVGYVKEEPVFAGDRRLSAEPVFGTGVAFGSSTTPFGRFAVCNGTFSPGACSGDQTQPNGLPGQFTYNPGQSGANFRPYGAADTYNFAPDNYLVTPQERRSLFTSGTFDLTDNTRFTATATYNNRRSEQLLAAMPIVLGTGPGAGTIARTISISQFNLYNPFGRDVSRIQRRAVETGGRSFNQNINTFVFSGAFEGGFEIGDRFFSWDAGMTYAENDQTDTTDGLFNLAALRQALGPSLLVNGTPRCVSTPGVAASVIAGCVPLNLLGAPGAITQDMLDFSSFRALDTFGYTMKQYFANVSGDLFALPGGQAAFAAGLERREESGFDQPDALIASGNTTGNSRRPTAGGYSVEEAYAEVVLPLLSDVPFAHALEVSLASRYSDYSNFGDTTNSKAGIKWQPIEQLLVRANWSEGFRAPSINELFQGQSDNFGQASDPCSTTFGGGWANLNATQRARCVSQGVAVNGYDQGNSQIRSVVGGNQNLAPETSRSVTAGLVWSPDFVEGFDVSLDWWNIQLESIIAASTTQTVLNNCILEGQADFCSLITRAPGGAITNLNSFNVNDGSLEVEGYDFTMNYRLPETAFGNFSFNWDSVYLSKFIGDDGDNVAGEYFDRDNNWRIRSNLLSRWEMGDVGATYSVRFYSDQDEDCNSLVNDGFPQLCSDPTRIIADENGDPTQAAQNKIGSTTYSDASFYWTAPWNGKVTVGVNNLWDKEPPFSSSTFANSFDPQYDLQGRFYYVSYNQRF